MRTTLLYGCCAVSETPGGLRVGAQLPATAGPWRRSGRASRRAQMRRAARNLAISSKKSLCTSQKNESRGAKSSTSMPALHALLDVADAVGEGEGQLLDRRRSGFADVVAADRYRVPACGMCLAQNSIMSTTMRTAGRGGTIHSFCAMYSLSMSFWMVPPELRHAGRPASRRPRCTCTAPRWPRR